MKLSRTLAISLCVLTLSVGAFAATKMRLSTDSLVNGQKLPAGEYTVDCRVDGQNAEVKFIRKNKTVATVSGRVVALDKAPDVSAFLRSNNPDGTSMITEIQFEQDKSAVRFVPEPAAK